MYFFPRLSTSRLLVTIVSIVLRKKFLQVFQHDILTYISLISVDVISYTAYNIAITYTARANEIEFLPELTMFLFVFKRSFVRELS